MKLFQTVGLLLLCFPLLAATGDVSLSGAFASPTGGVLRLTGIAEPFAVPLNLPFEAESIVHRENLHSWTLYNNGVLKGAEGNADPRITFRDGKLSLGLWGMMLFLR